MMRPSRATGTPGAPTARTLMKPLIRAALLLPVLLLAYLLFWPVPIVPQPWTPPVPPPASGIYAPNEALKDIQRFGRGAGTGPEGIAVDAAGRIYAGYDDGRIVTFSANASSYQELAVSDGGRPLGVTFGPRGGLVIADAHKGLVEVGSTPTPKTLVTDAGGAPVRFADDIDNTRLDSKLYFTDVSIYPYESMMYEVLEHKGTGRLIEYDAATGESKVLLGGLHFANGVAVGPNDAYVLVTETSAYRITRYWLKGEKAGTHEVFIDNLPGLPDNISYSEKGRFWVALYAPRNTLLDRLLPGPAWLKKIVARLPSALNNPTARKAWVLGLDLDGKVIASLEYDGSDAYAPITSVEEWGPWLYFGSLTQDSLGRLPLNKIMPGSPPPPRGWERTPEKPHHFVPPKVEEEGGSGPEPTSESDDRRPS